MSNKSGFELRTDILGMAMGVLEGNREAKIQSFYSIPEEDRKGERHPVTEITSEDVIVEAQKLYAFVNERV
jgi:hypothetical protein